MLPVGTGEFLYKIHNNSSSRNMYEGDEELFGTALEAIPYGMQVSVIIQFGKPQG